MSRSIRRGGASGQRTPMSPALSCPSLPHARLRPAAAFRDRNGVAPKLRFIGTKGAQPAQAAANHDLLKQAVGLLAASVTGRELLDYLYRKNYRIVFDDKRLAVMDVGALCEPTEKLIVLKSGETPAFLALLLAHEATHARQNTSHDLFPSSHHRPEEAIKLSFAIEADAYAHQIQVAMELAAAGHAVPLAEMKARFPQQTAAAVAAVAAQPQALDNGAVVAAAFAAFYTDRYLRRFYEAAHLDWVESCLPDARPTPLHRQFNRAADPAWMKKTITWRGRKYLQDHKPDMSFADPLYSGLSPAAIRRIASIYRTRLQQPVPVVKCYGGDKSCRIQAAARQRRR